MITATLILTALVLLVTTDDSASTEPDHAAPPMTTLPESPEIRPAGSAVANDFMRRLAGLGPGALRLLRQTLQERLGTAAEQAGDRERARVLDHEINHRLSGRSAAFSS